MTEFQLRKIRNAPKRKPLSEKAKQNIATGVGIFFLVLILFWGGNALLSRLSSTKLFEFVTGLFGKDLIVDSEGHTNVLLLGVGGEGHEGKDLTDTIIVASLNAESKKVALLSLPRDLYTESSLGGSRVNRLYEQAKLKWGESQGIDFVRQTISDMLDVELHYVIKVDFEAFEKVVDSVGGIDIYVERTINDPEYPKDGTYEYETFFLPQGNQHLDGKTALKYVRSRKTSSDFDRSRRQQQVLIALKNKAKEDNMFSRKRLLKELYSSLSEHVETNISMREMLTFAEFGASFDSNNLSMATLNDESSFRGGFLYTPLRELYGGAYVLLPAGDNFDMLRHFVRLVLYGPGNLASFQIAVLNGTEISGTAAKVKAAFHRFGIETNAIGNARTQDLLETVWYVKDPSTEPLMPYLGSLLPGKRAVVIPPEYAADPKFAESKIILEIGSESLEQVTRLDIFRNIFSMKPETPPQTAAPDSK